MQSYFLSPGKQSWFALNFNVAVLSKLSFWNGNKQGFNNSSSAHLKLPGTTTLGLITLSVTFNALLAYNSGAPVLVNYWKNNGGNWREECALLTSLHLILATTFWGRDCPNFIDFKNFNLSKFTQPLSGPASIQTKICEKMCSHTIKKSAN